MLINGIRALLLAQASITTLAPAQTVGGVSFPGVFCDNPVQDFKPPYAVIHSDALNPEQTLDGTKTEEIEIDCVAFTEPAARAMKKAITDYLEPFLGAATADTLTDTITGVFPQNTTYSYLNPGDGRDTKWHIISAEYTVYYV